MSKSQSSRYAVVSRNTLKTLKNASTREEARIWKRESGKKSLVILDRLTSAFIS